MLGDAGVRLLTEAGLCLSVLVSPRTACAGWCMCKSGVVRGAAWPETAETGKAFVTQVASFCRIGAAVPFPCKPNRIEPWQEDLQFVFELEK